MEIGSAVHSHVDPVLPPELERLIFEDCALSHPISIPTFMLVARRVKTWTEPLLFRTICVTDTPPSYTPNNFHHFTMDILLREIQKRPASFFESAVKHLFIGEIADFHSSQYIPGVQTLLATFRGITALFASCHHFQYLPVLEAVPLQTLAIDLNSLFAFGKTPLDFLHPVFRNVTHLQVLSGLSRPTKEWAGIKNMPQLTHFAFTNPNERQMVIPALLGCSQLECCVLLCPLGVNGAFWLPDDVRFVAMSRPDDCGDWLRGITTEDDYWKRAEAVIAARRAELR
ncbi:hypothetical protein DFH07DRAFT_110108 [Mycena maculata]|uniref:Uncharacterized protein n=1 Tax=Mycena maculata TaxID=230809 RepID=A0AAD7I609_9AGAR|nr:hypothetical protein DFH07DRAFT_110108 [Mycena maculata]